eukprot:4974080-Pyramimonas_sp.AAC.1
MPLHGLLGEGVQRAASKQGLLLDPIAEPGLGPPDRGGDEHVAHVVHQHRDSAEGGARQVVEGAAQEGKRVAETA